MSGVKCQNVFVWVDYHFNRNPAENLKAYFDTILLEKDNPDHLIIENALLNKSENIFYVRELVEELAEKKIMQKFDMYESIKLYVNCKIKLIESGQLDIGMFLQEINSISEERFDDKNLSNIIGDISSLYWDYFDVEDTGKSFTIADMDLKNRDIICLDLVKKYATNN